MPCSTSGGQRQLLKGRPTAVTGPSVSFIIPIHYLILIIWLTTVVGASSFATSSSDSIRGHRPSLPPHQNSTALKPSNSSPSLLTKVLKNENQNKHPKSQPPPSPTTAASRTIRAVQFTERSSLVADLERNLFKAFRNKSPADRLSDGNLNENRANNQTRRSLGIIEGDVHNNLTQHRNAVRITLSPLLPESSTLPPIIVYEDVPRQSNRSTAAISTNGTELMKSEKYSLPVQITIAVGLLALIIVTTIGNIFVIGEFSKSSAEQI